VVISRHCGDSESTPFNWSETGLAVRRPTKVPSLCDFEERHGCLPCCARSSRPRRSHGRAQMRIGTRVPAVLQIWSETLANQIGAAAMVRQKASVASS
jgi:hypothetical protein